MNDLTTRHWSEEQQQDNTAYDPSAAVELVRAGVALPSSTPHP
jgi:hypothetical protein